MKIFTQILVIGAVLCATQNAQAQSEPTRIEVNPEILLNTHHYDFSPRFTNSTNNTVIFSSSRSKISEDALDSITGENSQDLYTSTLGKKGKWSEPVPLSGETINSEHSEESVAYNVAAKTLYFTRCPNEKNENLGSDIWFSVQNNDGSWTEAVMISLKPEKGAHFDVQDPAISTNNQAMVFSSNMETGDQKSLGGKDLWIVKYDKRTKSWGEPTNLGSMVNTAGEEIQPTMNADGSLNFSSTGHKSLGGYDIFTAKGWNDIKTTELTHLTKPINSSADEYSIVYSGPKSGYFVSNRPGGKGQDDIYSFREPPVLFSLQITVFDKDTREPVSNTKITLTGSDNTVVSVTTDERGRFDFEENGNDRYIKANTKYEITVEGKGHATSVDGVSTINGNESTMFAKEFYLEPKAE
ncbi:MAG: peptidoglycan-associated lipoprotein [Crocinitomicaceae bacterium]|jgi:peptidoglycan-associated lipoprotein